MPTRGCRLSPVVVLCLLLLGAGRGTPEAGPMLLAQSPPAPSADTIAKGRALFNDTALSGDGRYSCAKCHPDNGHTDNRTYVGVDVVNDGDPKGRSTPTLWGVGTRAAFSWAGTAPSLQANIRGIIVNRMKGPEPTPEAMAALLAYVNSLGYPPNPFLNANGTPSDAYDKKDLEDVDTGG